MKSPLRRLIRRRASYQQDLTITPYTLQRPDELQADSVDNIPCTKRCETPVNEVPLRNLDRAPCRSKIEPVSTAFDKSFGSDSSQSIPNCKSLAPLGIPLPHLLDLQIQGLQRPIHIKKVAPLKIVARTMSREAIPVDLQAYFLQEPRSFPPGAMGLGISTVMGDILSQLRDVEIESFSGFHLELSDNSIVVNNFPCSPDSEPSTPLPVTPCDPSDAHFRPLFSRTQDLELSEGRSIDSPAGCPGGARTSRDQWCSLVNLDSYAEVKALCTM